MKKFVKVGLISLAVLIALAIGVGAVVEHLNEPKPAQSAQKTATNPPTRAELLKLVNQVRAKNGVAPLTESPILDESAQWKAENEVKYNYFGHDKPGTTGVGNGLKYLESIGSPCGDGNIGENLTENIAGRNTAEQAVYSWKMSKPHFAAMIDARYTLTGFGIDQNEIVEHFCSPQRFTTPTTVSDTSN